MYFSHFNNLPVEMMLYLYPIYQYTQIGMQFETLKTNYEKAEKKSSEVRAINRKARDLFKQYANDASWYVL